MAIDISDGNLTGGRSLFIMAAFIWCVTFLFNFFHKVANPESAIRFREKRTLGFSPNEQARMSVIGIVVAGLIMEANRTWGWHDCAGYWTFFYVTNTGAVVFAILAYALLREVGRGAFILPIGIVFGSLFAAGLTYQFACLSTSAPH